MVRKSILPLLIALLFISCGNESPEEQVQYLSGYWEIVEVKLPDGSNKEFTPNYTLDYIQVDGDQGIRKKVTPQLDGSFLTNDSYEKFFLKIDDDSLKMFYETPFDTWQETVVYAKDSILVLQNSDNKVYTYKKFRTFNSEK